MSTQQPVIERTYQERKLQSLNDRRHYVAGCSLCETIKTRDHGHGPSHDASARCESGYREHCTCDTCF
jgi:hypothetical protein